MENLLGNERRAADPVFPCHAFSFRLKPVRDQIVVVFRARLDGVRSLSLGMVYKSRAGLKSRRALDHFLQLAGVADVFCSLANHEHHAA